MSYKCSICGMNDVEHPGDVCELCAIGQDPYASAIQQQNNVNNTVYEEKEEYYSPKKVTRRKVLLNGGSEIANRDPYGNSIAEQEQEDVQVYSAGQAPVTNTTVNQTQPSSSSQSNSTMSQTNGALTVGITKNISVDTQVNSTLSKLIRTLFKGIPFTLDDEITMFQVFPDYSGTALNAMGNACDQVIVYGKLNAGSVAENNDVEVYGHRDSNNFIIANKIINRATGTVVTPDRVVSPAVIWAIAVIAFLAMFFFIASYGVTGIVVAAIILLCLTNLPLVLKIIFSILGLLFASTRRH